MLAAIDDIHHGNGHFVCIDAAKIAIERQICAAMAAAFETARDTPKMALAPSFSLVWGAIKIAQGPCRDVFALPPPSPAALSKHSRH